MRLSCAGVNLCIDNITVSLYLDEPILARCYTLNGWCLWDSDDVFVLIVSWEKIVFLHRQKWRPKLHTDSGRWPIISIYICSIHKTNLYCEQSSSVLFLLGQNLDENHDTQISSLKESVFFSSASETPPPKKHLCSLLRFTCFFPVSVTELRLCVSNGNCTCDCMVMLLMWKVKQCGIMAAVLPATNNTLRCAFNHSKLAFFYFFPPLNVLFYSSAIWA